METTEKKKKHKGINLWEEKGGDKVPPRLMTNQEQKTSQERKGKPTPGTSTKPTADAALDAERLGAPPRPGTRQTLQHQPESLGQRRTAQRRYETDTDNLSKLLSHV